MMPLAGGDPVTLASNLLTVSDLVVDANNVYFTSNTDLMKVPIAGGSVVTMLSKFGRALALDATTIYTSTANGIAKVSKSGGTPVTLASGQTLPGRLAVDATSVHWIDEGSLLNPDGAIRKIAK